MPVDVNGELVAEAGLLAGYLIARAAGICQFAPCDSDVIKLRGIGVVVAAASARHFASCLSCRSRSAAAW
jgi:hypothetical protein